MTDDDSYLAVIAMPGPPPGKHRRTFGWVCVSGVGGTWLVTRDDNPMPRMRIWSNTRKERS